MPTPTVPPTATPARATAGQSPDNLRQMGALKFSATFGQLVSILMRSAQHRHSFLADLEWLVLPAIATRQFAIVDPPNAGNIMRGPVAAILFATVSAEVDRRLTNTPSSRVRLKPEEWTSGDIPWLIEAVGEPAALSVLTQKLLEQRFKSTGLKTYSRGRDGRPTVGHLRPGAAPAAAAAAAA
jgi:hemolysin-activating ACP:hemolysin acyltransferase